MRMEIKEFINTLDDCKLEGDKIVISGGLHRAIESAKSMSFDMLKSITAVDLSNGEVELIYLLYSVENDENLFISIKTNSEAETVTDIFPSAVADENEIYDMFGIHFLNNDKLKRLYMPESWDGYPLRKDYVSDDTRLAWNDNEENS
jgi:NADH:ubiquinone oxidoreductase subunit C